VSGSDLRLSPSTASASSHGAGSTVITVNLRLAVTVTVRSDAYDDSESIPKTTTGLGVATGHSATQAASWFQESKLELRVECSVMPSSRRLSDSGMHMSVRTHSVIVTRFQCRC
jgi:hypothetical protein